MATLPMHQPSPDIADAIRATLPPELHHLVEPIARYLTAAAELHDLAHNPRAGILMAQAMATLGGKDVQVGNRLITFGAGSQLGDMTMRDLAGRDIVHLTINLGVPSTPRSREPELDADQLRVLRLLNEAIGSLRNRVIFASGLAGELGWETQRLLDDLEFLYERGFLKKPKPYQGGDHILIELTPDGRRYLRNLEQEGDAL